MIAPGQHWQLLASYGSRAAGLQLASACAPHLLECRASKAQPVRLPLDEASVLRYRVGIHIVPLVRPVLIIRPCWLQFRAISRDLWHTEDYHKAVRRKAVRYMR